MFASLVFNIRYLTMYVYENEKLTPTSIGMSCYFLELFKIYSQFPSPYKSKNASSGHVK